MIFFVKYQNMIPLMVPFNRSEIFAFRSLCVANSLILLSTRYVFTKASKNYVPLSVCTTFRRLLASLKICSNAFLIAIPCLNLSGFNHAYLDKTSITTIMSWNTSLCFESLLISTKSISHCSWPRFEVETYWFM